MKLLFVENRYATWVYAAVAERLADEGHEIHWLVQNPVFAPRFGQVHRLRFPRQAELMPGGADYEWLARTDRGALHFGTGDAHYACYDQQIQALLVQLRPQAIFGEATEFHELLVIRRARELGLAYLSPNATRYPPDRLAFMAYDSLDPVGGDGSALSDADAEALLDSIIERRVVPSYMRPPATGPLLRTWIRLQDKLRITAGWALGERYITPSPRRKLQLNAERDRQRVRWEERTGTTWPTWLALLQSGGPWVLYALQMQPEGNIDVWGSPWNDQAEIVRRSARALAAMGATLVVKPNPKSKYEMSSALNEVLRTEPNVIGLPHATPMNQVFPAAPLILSVTGTVLLEALFSGKPVACLGDHSMSRYPGITRIDQPEDLPVVLKVALLGRCLPASRDEACNLLQVLHRTSYAATVWDPIAQPEINTAVTMEALTHAFSQVLTQTQTNSCRLRGNGFEST